MQEIQTQLIQANAFQRLTFLMFNIL